MSTEDHSFHVVVTGKEPCLDSFVESKERVRSGQRLQIGSDRVKKKLSSHSRDTNQTRHLGGSDTAEAFSVWSGPFGAKTLRPDCPARELMSPPWTGRGLHGSIIAEERRELEGATQRCGI